MDLTDWLSSAPHVMNNVKTVIAWKYRSFCPALRLFAAAMIWHPLTWTRTVLCKIQCALVYWSSLSWLSPFFVTQLPYWHWHKMLLWHTFVIGNKLPYRMHCCITPATCPSLTSDASFSLDHLKKTLGSTSLQPLLPKYYPCQESNSEN